MNSAIYTGHLAHARRRPVVHQFRYPVYLMLFDLDELPALGKSLFLFSYNRPNAVSLKDRDYKQSRGAGIAASIRGFLEEQGAPRPARILALTHARLFGYVFNPVSFFYAYDSGGALQSVVAEVNNTFGDTHRYLLDARCRVPGDAAAYETNKLMHVSPFFSMLGRYRFRFPHLPSTEAGSPLEVGMDYEDEGVPSFTARLTLCRRPLTNATLARTLLGYPWMTMRVIAAIHFEALKLWWKKVPFYPRPDYDPKSAALLHEQQKPLHRVPGAVDPTAEPIHSPPPGDGRTSALAPRPPHAAVS